MPRQTTPHTKLGQLIRASGKNQTQIAADVGIHYIKLSRLANLHDQPTPSQAFKLADYFHVNPEDVIGLAD